MIKRLRHQPVALFALAEAIVGVLVAAGLINPAVGGAIGAVIAVFAGTPRLGVVQRTVTPVTKVVDLVGGTLGEVNDTLRRLP